MLTLPTSDAKFTPLEMGHHPSQDLGTGPPSLEKRTKCTNRTSASRWLETETSSNAEHYDEI